MALLVLVVIILLPILIQSGDSNKKPDQDSTPTTYGDAETSDDLPLVSLTGPSESDETPSSEEEPGIDTTTGPSSDSDALTNSGILKHLVEAGETTAEIASEMGVTVEELMADNELVSASQVVQGQTLYAYRGGLVHVIKRGQTLTDISITYGISVRKIAEANGISDPGRIFAGQRIVIPEATINLWQKVVHLSRGEQSRFIWPLEGEVVSTFGWRTHPVLGTRHHHNGIDIDVPSGTIVNAAASGNVYSVIEEEEAYGTMVVLQHADNYLTIYGHLSSVMVSKGQYVEVGQPIAESGNTGLSTGPHLHFEIRNGEFPVDPQRYLPG
jgi:LysM repeat protein